MPFDFRYDPFTKTYQSVDITDEIKTIPANSPYKFRLKEIPKKDSPSTIRIRVRDTLNAAVASTGATYILVDNPTWFAVNNVLAIDSEKMQVTAISGGSSATTLNGAISSTSATSFTATSGAALKIGQIIKIDTELMLITNIVSNTVTITRGYKGTTAATHSSGASIYPQNELTVTRGYSGTTATTHTNGTVVFIEGSMSEVSSTPAAGQFWPDYTTNGMNNSDWNTGTVLFNSGDAGKVVSVDYKGLGTLGDTRVVTHKTETFTASGTFVVPEGITTAWVTLCGGGGGGGGTGTGGGGGGGGWYYKEPVAVVQGESIAITIGAGGAGSVNSTGGTGGTTSFGAYLSATGGAGGIPGGSSGAGGAGGTPNGQYGGSRHTIVESTGSFLGGGNGGSTPLGMGGISFTGSTGTNGTGYGAGGASRGSAGGTGLNGTAGIVIVEY